MRKLFGGIMTLMIVGLIFMVGCEKDPVVNSNEGQIELAIVNPSLSGSLKNGTVGVPTGLKNGDGPGVPVCKDESPAYVEVTLDGNVYTVDILQSYGSDTLTAMLKLPADTYTMSRFDVYASNGDLLWASPIQGSYYANLFGLQNIPEMDIVVEPFKKALQEVDVLCWQDYDYENFGYEGFDINYIKVKTICFFGDVCTKFYKEWHELDGSPYGGVSDYLHDFNAIFSVNIFAKDDYEANGASATALNDPEVNSNIDWLGVGAPLCIEYPDYLGQDDEYVAVISLTLPTGESTVIGSVEFTDDDATVAELAGDDGIFDFLVGGSDCIQGADYDGIYELPWMPLPETVQFTLKHSSEAYFELSNIGIVAGDESGDFVNGANLPAWCGNDTLWIHWNDKYEANVYPYYAIPDTSQYATVSGEQWSKLNWIANNAGSASVDDIQKAIWFILDQSGGVNNALAQAAASHGSYIPPIGGYMTVLVDPYLNITHPGSYSDSDYSEEPGIQLAIVRFDP